MIRNIAYAVFASAALATSANATVHTFSCNMDGFQETPPVATPATGIATVTLNDVTGQVTVVSGSYTGLLGPCNNAHIHGPAAIGAGPAGVIQGITHTGGTTGTLSGGGILNATNMGHMLAGNTYINVHSTAHSGGEIRGQLILVPPIPTVSEWGMIVLGLVVLTGGTLAIRRHVAATAPTIA
jgi:hypothetical protein